MAFCKGHFYYKNLKFCGNICYEYKDQEQGSLHVLDVLCMSNEAPGSWNAYHWYKACTIPCWVKIKTIQLGMVTNVG